MAGSVRQERTPSPDDVNVWFFQETAIDALLVGAQLLRSSEDLAIEDLTPEEARSFLRAVEE